MKYNISRKLLLIQSINLYLFYYNDKISLPVEKAIEDVHKTHNCCELEDLLENFLLDFESLEKENISMVKKLNNKEMSVKNKFFQYLVLFY